MAGQRIKIGGWRVEATLGQGGMGVVYLARHAESGQRAALKTLLASPQRFDIASLRSEIAILRELDHPGVITLLDHGVDTLPWMAMERVVGQPLSAHMAGSSATLHNERSSSAPSWLGTQPLLTASSHGSGERALKGEATLEAGSTLHPDNSMWSETLAPDSAVDTSPPDTPHIPPPSALVMEAAPLAPVLIPEEPDIRQKVLLGYMGQVCQALAYVHGQGIVHADVKPGNVLVSEQGRAVLVDFGLATPFGNRVDVSAMDRAGLLAGSVSYIAPEQIGGEELDARADLYALGCILCEVLTGRPPFTGLAREMLEQHLHAAPPNLPDTVPHEMRELVARLLAKDRLSRPGHAQVVVHTLEQLGVEVPELPASYRPQPYLYRPRLAGRQALMGHLMTHLVEGADGGLTLLCGESGIGKTHVAMEVVREARQRSSHIVLLGHGSRLGTGDEQQARQPLSLFRSILRQIADMCVASGPRSAQRVFGSDAAILKPVASFVANLPGIEPAQELPEMAADAARMRLFGAWVRVLRRYCATKPTLMVLDDVQWADDLSLRALRYLLGELAAVPWRIICTCRAEQVPPAIEALRELRSCEWLDVPRLDERAVGEIVAQMLGQAPEGLVSVVSRRGGGNAFFVAEYLRTAVEQELLTMDEAGRWILATGDGQEIDTRLATLPEPGSVMELITARLARLKPRERLLCDAAAVVGREVPLDLLAQVAQTPLGAMEAALQGLRRRQILEDAQPGMVRFVHDKLHEVAYGRIEASKRPLQHQRCAELLSAWLDQGHDIELGQVAWHYRLADKPTKARAYFIRAAQSATARYALAEATRHYEAALGLFTDPCDPDALTTSLDLIEHVLINSDLERAVIAAQNIILALEAAALSPQKRALLAARAHISLGRALIKLNRYEDVLSDIQHGLAYASDAHSRPLQALASETLGFAHVQGYMRSRSDLYNAGSALEAFLASLELTDDPRQRGRNLRGLGILHYHQGDFDEASQYWHRALHEFQACDDRPGVSITCTNLGNLHNRQARYDEALRYQIQGLQALEGMGDRLAEARVINNIGNVYMDMGQLPKAIEAYERALALQELLPHKKDWLPVTSHLAIAYCCAGRLVEALTHARGAVQRERAHPQRPGLAGGIKILAWIALSYGALDEATEALNEALAMVRAQRDTFFKADTLACLAKVQRLAGDFHAAERSMTEALELFRARKQRKYEMLSSCEYARLMLESPDRAPDALALLNLCLDDVMTEDARAEALVYRAMAHRLLGDLKASRSDLEASLKLYQKTCYILGRVPWYCQRGQLAWACDEEVAPWLAEAERLLHEGSYLPDSEATLEVRRLHQAIGRAPTPDSDR